METTEIPGEPSSSSVVISNSYWEGKLRLYIKDVETSFSIFPRISSDPPQMKDPNGNEFITWKITLEKVGEHLNKPYSYVLKEAELLKTNLPKQDRTLVISFKEDESIAKPEKKVVTANMTSLTEQTGMQSLSSSSECDEPFKKHGPAIRSYAGDAIQYEERELGKTFLDKAVEGNGVYCCTLHVRVYKMSQDYISHQSKIPGKYLDLGSSQSNLRVIEKLKRLCMEGQSKDVTIKCGDKIYQSHQCILGEIPILKTKLEEAIDESGTKTIPVENVCPQVMELLLNFLYFGEIDFPPNNSDVISKLLKCAKEYNLPECKSICFYQMLRTISLENAGEFTYSGLSL